MCFKCHKMICIILREVILVYPIVNTQYMVALDITIMTAVIINLIITLKMCSEYTLFSPKGFDHSYFSNEQTH